MAVPNSIGDVFDRLTIIGPAPNDGKHRAWLCRCECGKIVAIRQNNLRTGNTKSCGCVCKSTRTGGSRPRHGHASKRAPTPTYNSWVAMVKRCTDPNEPNYNDYGGRGITVCQRWRTNFIDFLEDMGERPTGKTLGRIDNNKGYYKENCRWETYYEQNRNRRDTVMLTYKGITQRLCEWENICGIKANVLRNRIYKGWPPNRIIEQRQRAW